MYCPFCNADDTKVIDSRLIREGNQTRRRRECPDCKERFTTYEVAELSLPRVIKRDGRRAPFSEDKLRAGTLRALEKRPVSTEQIEIAIARIIRKAMTSGERRNPFFSNWGMGHGRITSTRSSCVCSICFSLSLFSRY